MLKFDHKPKKKKKKTKGDAEINRKQITDFWNIWVETRVKHLPTILIFAEREILVECGEFMLRPTCKQTNQIYTGCDKKVSPKFLCHFLAIAENFKAKFHTFITHLYSRKNAEGHSIIFKIIGFFATTSSLRTFTCSIMHAKRNGHYVCAARKTHCYSNNRISKSALTVKTRCPPPAFTHAFDLLVRFLTA